MATKKDVEATARILQIAGNRITNDNKQIGDAEEQLVRLIAQDFAELYRSLNPRFDSVRFFSACGYPKA